MKKRATTKKGKKKYNYMKEKTCLGILGRKTTRKKKGHAKGRRSLLLGTNHKKGKRGEGPVDKKEEGKGGAKKLKKVSERGTFVVGRVHAQKKMIGGGGKKFRGENTPTLSQGERNEFQKVGRKLRPPQNCGSPGMKRERQFFGRATGQQNLHKFHRKVSH